MHNPPTEALSEKLASIGAVELTTGVWIAPFVQPVNEVRKELACHLTPDQSLTVLEAVHGGWDRLLGNGN